MMAAMITAATTPNVTPTIRGTLVEEDELDCAGPVVCVDAAGSVLEAPEESLAVV